MSHQESSVCLLLSSTFFPCQSSTTDSQSYSLQIPLGACAPTALLAAHMASLPSSNQKLQQQQPRTLLPNTSAPLPFFQQLMGRFPNSMCTAVPTGLLHSHNSFTSLPDSPCPKSSAFSLTCSYNLAPLSLDPGTSFSNDQMPAMSVTPNSPRILPWLFPLPQESLMRA